MHSYSSAYLHLSKALRPIYDDRESSAIAHEVLEHVTGATRLQRITEKDKQLTTEQQAEYDRVVPILIKGTPMQYVLGYTWFMGNKYTVNEHVLIPRPETEELVDWIIKDYKGKNVTILDIGTGSGCIPIALKLAVSDASVSSIDISVGAVDTAQQNAKTLGTTIQFQEFDFLDDKRWKELPSYDIVVSNPPYIPEAERETLDANVREHEPDEALFVPSDDALLFYRKIAQFGHTHLKENGAIYCELHVDYAIETERLFKELGYTQTELKKDMHGNMRMLKAQN